MEDPDILALFLERKESAIAETDRKYGAFCRRIANNLLQSREDAEECVSDVYRQAWEELPKKQPANLKAWLGQVTRNLAVNLYHKNHAQKRYNGIEQALDELAEGLPSPKTVERELEDAALEDFLNKWLRSLEKGDRALFLRRYWYGVSLNSLAEEAGLPPSRLAKRMFRLRKNLRAALEKEGFTL